jgi:hypothetical protein
METNIKTSRCGCDWLVFCTFLMKSFLISPYYSVERGSNPPTPVLLRRWPAGGSAGESGESRRSSRWVFSSVDVSDWETVAVNIVWSQQCCVRRDGGAAGMYVYQVSILRIRGQHYSGSGAWFVRMGHGWNSLRIVIRVDWAVLNAWSILNWTFGEIVRMGGRQLCWIL